MERTVLLTGLPMLSIYPSVASYARRKPIVLLRLECALLMTLCLTNNVAGQAVDVQDLSPLSIEDLMNVQVTSVSKREQSLSSAGAAAYVITQEDIRRSGMTNIPDLLRMAPGVNVARITANTWAISVRGFNDRYSKKVLVLIDGRSVYTPVFSGVYWDQQSVPIEDIDRIEVIRGPGGTLWGANAVNGVIHIITKHSKDTQGGLVSAGVGSQESAQGLVRYGAKAGDKGFYRVYGKYFNVENSVFGDGRKAADGWHGSQGGFRSDWQLSTRDSLTVEGDVYQAREGQTITAVLSNDGFKMLTFNDRIEVDATNLLGRWNRTLDNGSEATLQVFYSNARRYDQGTDNLATADVDFQYRFELGGRHNVVAGAGYRHNALTYRGAYGLRSRQPHLSGHLLSAFVQDEIRLTREVTVALGSKFEHNNFTGFEFEPSAQLVWTPNKRNAVWASVARAIRQPSFSNNSIELDYATFPLDGGGFSVSQIQGSPDLQAERMFDYEAGYRTRIGKWISMDITGFRSHYRCLTTIERGTPFFVNTPLPPHVVQPALFDNLGRGRTYGTELFTNWRLNRRWRVGSGVSFLRMNLLRDAASNDFVLEPAVGNSPQYQIHARSTLDLPRNLEWDVSAYYVGALRVNLDGLSPVPVASYTRLDTRLGWRAGEMIDFSIGGQNLLVPRHMEFSRAYHVHSTQVQRSVLGKLTWRF